VKPNPTLRKKLEKLSAEKLFVELKKKDPRRAETIDAQNKVRLIRALEIIESLGKVPAIKGSGTFFSKGKNMYLTPYKVIALNPPKEILHSRIEKRLRERLEQGMVEEVKRLHDEGVSWKRLEGFGLEYRWCARFLQGIVSREEMRTNLLRDSKHYAKHQLTFLRRLERTGIPLEWKES
jgi:tRNA dimethylallyltransferase